jgi:DNA-binding NarL/FixJ family response regulator
MTVNARAHPSIVIADDHRLILSALRFDLESAGFVVSGEARTGADALDLILGSVPDLALLDVHMPEGKGYEVARVLSHELPEVKVVLITATPTEDGAVEAIRAGAVGYLDKTISSRRLAEALFGVNRGEGSFPRRFLPRLGLELREAALSQA